MTDKWLSELGPFFQQDEETITTKTKKQKTNKTTKKLILWVFSNFLEVNRSCYNLNASPKVHVLETSPTQQSQEMIK